MGYESYLCKRRISVSRPETIHFDRDRNEKNSRRCLAVFSSKFLCDVKMSKLDNDVKQ
jgi:hypothetical protein